MTNLVPYLNSIKKNYPKDGVSIYKHGSSFKASDFETLSKLISYEASRGHDMELSTTRDHFIMVDTGINIEDAIEGFGTTS